MVGRTNESPVRAALIDVSFGPSAIAPKWTGSHRSIDGPLDGGPMWALVFAMQWMARGPRPTDSAPTLRPQRRTAHERWSQTPRHPRPDHRRGGEKARAAPGETAGRRRRGHRPQSQSAGPGLPRGVAGRGVWRVHRRDRFRAAYERLVTAPA